MCLDQAEYCLGIDTLLKHLSSSLDGRRFVRYWKNTQYGVGCADGRWSYAFAGEVTTNNALESYNGRMKDMVFGRGRMRRSAMWCIDRYVYAMSLVRDMQGTHIEGREDSVTMWNEWRWNQTAAAVNKATKEGLGLRGTMIETHCW